MTAHSNNESDHPLSVFEGGRGDGEEFYLDINEQRVFSTYYVAMDGRIGETKKPGDAKFDIVITPFEISFGQPYHEINGKGFQDHTKIDRRSKQITYTLIFTQDKSETYIKRGECQSSARPVTPF
jgi:hypothetical protein